MKYFFRRRIPDAADVLLIESGSPAVARRAIERIRSIFPSARYHLCTCHPLPSQTPFTTVYQANEYPTGWQKLKLVLSFCRRGWSVLVILCTGEPILWRWKMLALFLMPAKVLVVNEHSDFFWLDWGNRRTLRALAGIRWGVNLEDIFFTMLRALVFPLTFLFLLASVVFLYLRRARRLLWWKLKATAAPPSPHRQPVCVQPRQSRER